MAEGNLREMLLIAVVSVVESWLEEDTGALGRANGLLTEVERSVKSAQARAKREDSLRTLAERLPPNALSNLQAGLHKIAPRADAAVGETARRWSRPEDRVATAIDLLNRAAAYERESRTRAEAARAAAEDARLEAEAEVRAAAERAARLESFRASAEEKLQEDFLGADAWFATWDTGGTVTFDDFRGWKAAFVQRWARDVLKDDRLDVDQAGAVASTTGDLRLVARAGSGKTRTLVTRALFLQLHCGVEPDAIILVAFNRKAVEEIRVRLSAALPVGVPLPHVVTFHALANALLRPEEDLVFDDEDAETLGQSMKIQSIINELLSTRKRDVRAAMLGFFRDDWKAIKKRGLHMDRAEFFAERAEVTRVTLGGEYVKSFGERLIANTMFEHGVDYKYERNFLRGGFNYRPDFTVFIDGRARVVIEYFGMLGEPEYDEKAALKREFWAHQSDVLFLEFNPAQVASLEPEGFESLLLNSLRRAGVQLRRLDEDEIWARVQDRAIDSFSKAQKAFVGRARQLNLAPGDVRAKMDSLVDPASDVLAFLRIAADVYSKYLDLAKREGFEDFSGVMWRAAAAIETGQVNWVRDGGKQRGDLTWLRFIHIDEFQDFSEMFMEFVTAIRSQAPNAVLCCVGDDWQAINGFAGADLRFFENFEQMFPDSSSHAIATNYRSPIAVVDQGNIVMSGHGTPARAAQVEQGAVQVMRLAQFNPTPHEQTQFPGDIGTPALLRLIQAALEDVNATVVVLFRRNTVPWPVNTGQGAFGRKLDGYLTYLRGHLPKGEAERIDVTTAHKYKGREADVVIVGDADDRNYPLIHPTVPLFEIFGDTVDTIVEAERRLFYVATTRAETRLVYLVPHDKPTEFLDGVREAGSRLEWESLAPVSGALSDHLEVRIYDAYDVRKDLKDRFGFTYNDVSKTWWTMRPADGFDFEHVRHVLGFVGPRLIEVRNERDEVIHTAGSRLGWIY